MLYVFSSLLLLSSDSSTTTMDLILYSEASKTLVEMTDYQSVVQSAEDWSSKNDYDVFMWGGGRCNEPYNLSAYECLTADIAAENK